MTILNTNDDQHVASSSPSGPDVHRSPGRSASRTAAIPASTSTSTWSSVTIVFATVLAGLFAGFFLTYSASVQLGLARVDDLTYVRTFQEINATIRNPVFAVLFFGCVPAIALALVLHRRGQRRRTVLLAVGATACTAVMAITFLFNVPLNNELATFVDPSIAEARIARDGFETVWNRWNLARSILSVIGSIAVASAAVPSLERR